MPRRRRIIVPELPHHFTQRGNNRGNVFDCDADRILFLDLLGEYAQQYRLTVMSDCLMTNHFHLRGATGRRSLGCKDARPTGGGLRPLSSRSTPHFRTTCGRLATTRFRWRIRTAGAPSLMSKETRCVRGSRKRRRNIAGRARQRGWEPPRVQRGWTWDCGTRNGRWRPGACLKRVGKPRSNFAPNCKKRPSAAIHWVAN